MLLTKANWQCVTELVALFSLSYSYNFRFAQIWQKYAKTFINVIGVRHFEA